MQNRIATLLFLGTLGAAGLAAQAIAPNTEFRVKLLTPLGTQTNQKGDKITATVVTPPDFAGATMEGEVKESKRGGKINGKSVLHFTFNRLIKDGKATDISADVKGLVNSQGKANTDEEGRVVEKKSNVGKMAAATGAGALIGAIAGGGKGAAIGAGVGAAASLVLIQTTAKGADISFAPGSEVILSVQERRQSQ